MREIINLVKPLLVEAVAYRGNGFQIISDPSVAQLRAMMEKANHNEGLRAVISGQLFVWDGYFMNHDEANKVLGGDDDVETPKKHLRRDHVELDVANLDMDDWSEDDDDHDGDFAKDVVIGLAETIRSNRIIRAFYGIDARIMVDDGSNDEWLETYLAK